jgi:hypothetical protein
MGFPTNIADAAAAYRDGSLGLIEEIKIGDLVVSALTAIDYSHEMEITEKPLQAGYDATDAAKEIPIEINIDICLANPDYSIEAGLTAALTGNAESLVQTWRDKKNQLYEYWKTKTLVSFQSHESIEDSLLIRSIRPYFDVDENYDAFFANVTLKKIKIVGQESEDFSTDIKKKTAPKSNAGKR